MSKYSQLYHYLTKAGPEHRRLTFLEIEHILGTALPRSARSYPEWWANDQTPNRHSAAWLEAGWETENVDLASEAVTFRRAETRQFLRKSAAARHGSSSVGSASIVNLPDAPEGAVDIAISMQWKRLGEVAMDDVGKLSFPKCLEVPALYRLRLSGPTNTRHYIGEAINLRRRFGNYRNPGPSQATSLRINDVLRTHLADGGNVEVDLIISGIDLLIEGKSHSFDLANKATRRLLEQAAVVANAAIDIESLNR